MKKGMKRILFCLLAVIVAGAGAGVYYVNTNQEADPLVLYNTVLVEYGDVSKTVAGEAHVRNTGVNSVFVEVPQTVSLVHVEEGDVVSAGQLLIEYDIEPDLAELNRQISEAQIYASNASLTMQNIARPAEGNDLISYESAVLSAQKNITDTQAEMETLQNSIYQQRLKVQNLRNINSSYRDDWRDDLIEEEDYDTARTNYRVAQVVYDGLVGQLESKALALESYQSQLQYAEQRLENALNPMDNASTAARYSIQQNLAGVQGITIAQLQADAGKLAAASVSPVDGYVQSVNVLEGGTASSGIAVVEIADASKSVIRFEASEFDAPQVRSGQKVIVTAAGIPGKEYAGVVTKIYAQALEKDHSEDNEIIVPVEITLSNAGDELKVGYTVDVQIILDERVSVLQIPAQALFYDGDDACIYAIEEGEIVPRVVETGFYGDKTVEILSGLNADAIVITTPQDVEISIRGPVRWAAESHVQSKFQ